MKKYLLVNRDRAENIISPSLYHDKTSFFSVENNLTLFCVSAEKRIVQIVQSNQKITYIFIFVNFFLSNYSAQYKNKYFRYFKYNNTYLQSSFIFKYIRTYVFTFSKSSMSVLSFSVFSMLFVLISCKRL